MVRWSTGLIIVLSVPWSALIPINPPTLHRYCWRDEFSPDGHGYAVAFNVGMFAHDIEPHPRLEDLELLPIHPAVLLLFRSSNSRRLLEPTSSGLLISRYQHSCLNVLFIPRADVTPAVELPVVAAGIKVFDLEGLLLAFALGLGREGDCECIPETIVKRGRVAQ
jgi:hypothetical protein